MLNIVTMTTGIFFGIKCTFKCIYKPVLFIRKPLKAIQTFCKICVYGTYIHYNILQTLLIFDFAIFSYRLIRRL